MISSLNRFPTPLGFISAALVVLLIAQPAAQAPDVVLYASDVSVVTGNWAKLVSTSGAGGLKMTSEDRGWSNIAPLSTPADYFEAEFDVQAGVSYRLWLRLRAFGDSKWNDSVWVQFSGAIDGNGSALWPIGAASALLVNLEDCGGCGVSSWGWQDNGWWLGNSSIVRFSASGRHRIRIQTREDGVDIDQIILSAGPYLSAPPGGVSNDPTIVSKSGSSGALARGPYLQQITDHSATVIWTTPQPGYAELRYTTPVGQVSIAAQTRLITTAETGLAYDYYQHEARVFGLAPASRYAYDVLLNGGDLTPGQDAFTTAPPTGSGTVRFIAFGDSGVGSTAQRDLAARMLADSFDLAIHTGDLAYASDGYADGSYASYENNVFGVYGAWFRARPFFPSIGNHDDLTAFAQPYRDVFVLPDDGGGGGYPDHAERYYSFDYGPIHFIALDTEQSFIDPARRQAQLAWLETDLASTAQPWRVVYFHKPPYSAGLHHGSNLEVRQAFAPIFERYHVQLALSGHDHDYERTLPMREFDTSGGAVTYVVSGGGGAPLYPVGVGSWTALSASAHHYVRAIADECVLRVEAVRIDAVVFDSVSLARCTDPTPTPGGQSNAYGGIPATLPGTIQSENFDEGEPGIAYADNTPGNAGGAYRPTDVDIASADDVGGGYTVGWVGSGEWLKYSVQVSSAGTYDLQVRVASAGVGGSFHIEVDGVDKTGPVSVPDTGGWQTWATIRVPAVTLNAGTQVWRVSMDTRGPSGAVANFNWIAAVLPNGSATGGGVTPFGGTPVALPGTIQSENFDEGDAGIAYHDHTPGNIGGQYRATDVDIASAEDEGGGYTLGWVGAGEWQAYTVTVGASGTYAVEFRVACYGPGGTFHLEVDGVDRTGPLSVPDTGGWQSWVTMRKTGVTLGSGPQLWRIVMDANGPGGAVGNFNWFTVR